MSIHRRAAKRDGNEPDIVNALVRAGAVVHRLSATGIPDLLVGFRGETFLLEIKDDRGTLTDDEKSFFTSWSGTGGGAFVVRSALDALQAIGAV